MSNNGGVVENQGFCCIMKVVFYTNTVSPHQTPLALEIIKILGVEKYRYIYTDMLASDRNKMGWVTKDEDWLVYEREKPDLARALLESAEILMSENRDLNLFLSRTKAGKLTIYESERWFKPWKGMLRLLMPSYFRMAWRFVKLLRTSDRMYYFPMGIHAARDMARLCGLFTGDLRCLFKAPKLKFESKPGGRVYLTKKKGKCVREEENKYCINKMRMWGYFVRKSTLSGGSKEPNGVLRVLWVGRFLKLKCVDTIIHAVGEVIEKLDESSPFGKRKIVLDIYGLGPEEKSLKKMSAKYGEAIRFYPPVVIDEVRRLMREHDVYVFSSDGHDGWGAVVSEALEEGLLVLGTREAGACATILPESHLFCAGDYKGLSKLLMDAFEGKIGYSGIGAWTAEKAAERLLGCDFDIDVQVGV